MSNHTSHVPFVVAIPVRNERERIVECLLALAGQVDIRPADVGILIFLNNCTDGTRDAVEAWMSLSPCPVRLIEQNSAAATAGWARREAMDAGAAWLDEGHAPRKILLTSDADSRVPEGWVARNAAALQAGADAVAGQTTFDPGELARLPEGLRQRLTLERRYESLLAEIEARLAPRDGNPWPCHWTASGASIAVSLDAYRRVGGLPPVPSGEDHAFIERLRGHGLVVRHAPDIVVTTSGRLDGRAREGTADTLRRHAMDIHGPCDIRLERLMPFVGRMLLRRVGIAAEPTRRRTALRPGELPRQIARAGLVLSWLRALEAHRGGTRPSGSGLSSPPKRLSTP